MLPLSADAEAEIQTLETERDADADEVEGDDDNCEYDTQDRIEEINERIRAIRASRQRDYSEEIKALCGVIVGVGHNGQAEVIRGLLRKEDEAALVQTGTGSETASTATPSSTEADESPAYSAALVDSLTQHKTAAIAIELSQQPSVALAALVHALVLNEFGLDLHFYRAKSSVQVSSRQAFLADATGSTAFGNA